jgi:hypothetical protein
MKNCLVLDTYAIKKTKVATILINNKLDYCVDEVSYYKRFNGPHLLFQSHELYLQFLQA